MNKQILFLLVIIYCNKAVYAQNDSIRLDQNEQEENFFSSCGYSLDTSNFNQGVVFSPLQLIKSRVPGFVVNCSDGNDPNATFQIQTRGTSTLYSSSNPLYIVDGIPIDNLSIISPYDIASIKVYKSFAETAFYGSRGADGVVVIETKNSTNRRFSLNYETYLSIEKYAHASEYMNATEWLQLKEKWASSDYDPLNSIGARASDYDYGDNTDWREVVSQNKVSNIQHLHINGQVKNTSYSAMMNYSNNYGIIQKTDNETLSGQFTLSQKALKSRLNFTGSIYGYISNADAINRNPYLTSYESVSGTREANFISLFNKYNPTVPAYNADGSIYKNDDLNETPLQILKNSDNKIITQSYMYQAMLNYNAFKGFDAQVAYSGYSFDKTNNFSRYGTTYGVIWEDALSESNNEKRDRFLANLNYNLPLKSHTFNFKMNSSLEHNQADYSFLDSSYWDYGTQWSKTSSTSGYEYKRLSFSCLLNYSFQDKYFLMLNETREYYLDNDNDSQFELDYPSVAIAWDISKESFFTPSKWMNELKLRASYGTSKRIVKEEISTVDYTMLLYNGDNVNAEKMQELNLGFDAQLVSNRFVFSVDYYRRKTLNAVWNDLEALWVEYFYFNGIPIMQNNIEILNSGIELSLKGTPVQKAFKWSFDFNLAFNKNKILSDMHYYASVSNKDKPIGSFFGYKYADYNLDNFALYVYNDEGEKVISTEILDETQIIGNGHPKSFVGFFNIFSYKNFDLSFLLKGAFGFQIYNDNNVIYPSSVYNQKKEVLTINNEELLKKYYANEYIVVSEGDYMLEQGDYLKIDNITLSYTLPIKNNVIRNLKVYFSANNIATFTSFTGTDPEMVSITGAYPGRYYTASYPNTRIYTIGLKLSI